MEQIHVFTSGIVFITEPVTEEMFANGEPFTVPEAGWYDFGGSVPRKLTDTEVRERCLP